ncbi:MAG: hypothetical protein CVV02_18035 [Firmicutes bacterium HGW-Firmicutes-7]|nr:MAG: hypothetical protein CVV02_18035 [Firmicutes bacterium HGW-Firmicutes-7]
MDILVAIKDEDKEAIRDLYVNSFSDSVQFVDYYFKEKFISSRVMAIKEDTRITSMLHLNPFEVRFNGEKYHVSYIVAVATAIEYRKKGYMGRLMQAALNRLFESGEVFSLLMPIDSRIYERYGYGFIEDHLRFECDSATFMVKPTKYDYTVADDKDMSKLADIFEEFTKQFNLSTIRNSASFEMLYKELLTDNGKILIFKDGYVMSYYEDEILHIRELVSNTDNTFNEIISYIKEVTHLGKVVIMDHSRSPIKYITPNISQNIIKLQPFMMARIINVEAFMKANIKLFVNDIKIKVTDDFIVDNNHIFHIHNDTVSKNVDLEFDVEVDIKLLTQLAFGYMKATEIQSLKKKDFMNDILNNNFFNEYV